MNFKRLGIWFCAALLALTLWLWWWCQPERQVRRAQARLIKAVEARDFETLSSLLANDYRDGWEHDKTFVLEGCREVFGQFALLDIEREFHGVVPVGSDYVLREKLTLKGFGGPLALYARDRVNELSEPFEMKWRKKTWDEWELTSVAHPKLELR